MDFRRLPTKILKRIFTFLSFDQVAQLRGLSNNLHCASREILNDAFLDLGPQLVTQYTIHSINTKNNIERDVSENTAFRGRLLKLLRSEHSILLAYSRHYIAMNGCFAAGKILDLFYELKENKTLGETPDEENNRVAKLVLLIDQYLDWFERYRILNDERCWWFGACVVDLMDSYIAAKYNLNASHSGSMVKLGGRYTVNGYAETPPEIGDPLGRRISKNELLQVLRYLRKHARWHNFVRSFQDDLDEESGLDDEQEKIHTKKTLDGYDRMYRKKSYGFADNYANVVSLRAIINLECHESLAPARLRNCDDVKNVSFDDRKISTIINPSTDLYVNDDWFNPNQLDESASSSGRSLQNEATWLDNYRSNDGLYSFSLELKTVHPRKGLQYENGEKFGETTLNLNHTANSLFAAQSECKLY